MSWSLSGFPGLSHSSRWAVFCRSAVFVLLCCALPAGCGGTKTAGVGTRYPGAGASDGQICQDLVRMPQDLTPYAQKAGPNTLLLDGAAQAEAVEKSRIRMFRPWDEREPSKWVKKSLAADFNLKADKGYTENLRPFPPEEWARLRALAQPAAYPLRREYGITVRNTALRAMPTHKPLFLNPDMAGEGYPFDYLQHSALWVGSPVYICHVSTDGLWVLAETDFSAGWVPAEDVAVVDEAFMNRMRGRPLAALVRDRVILQAHGGPKDRVTGAPGAVTGHIGTLLPLAGNTSGGLTVLFPRRAEDGKAVWAEAVLGADAAAPWPLPATPANIARLGNEMMGQPYGWGGLFENRDCSALTRDLFIPFGLRLPRNSATQSKFGAQTELKDQAAEQKEAGILAGGKPFFSLIRMPGHIGLYLGEYEGKAAMFHNIWGLRVNTNGGDGPMTGRAVIGKAVVTSLRPGVELPNLATPAGLLDRVDCLTNLPEAEKEVAPAPRKQISKAPAGRQTAKTPAGRQTTKPPVRKPAARR